MEGLVKESIFSEVCAGNQEASGWQKLPASARATRLRQIGRTLVLSILAASSACFRAAAMAGFQQPSAGHSSTLASARAFLDAGKLREAEEAVQSYLAEHRNEADAHYLLAFILFREKAPARSLAEYTLAASLQQPNAKQLFYVALDYVLAKDYPDADKWMTQVTEQKPQDSEAWYGLGRIKYSENLFQASIDCFEKALSLTPHLVKAENNLGLAYEGLNQVDAAIEAYRAAITWQADSSSPSEQPLVNLGIVLVDRNNFSEALPLLQQAAKIAPDDARIRAALGRLYLRQGDFASAQGELQLAVTVAPKIAAYHFLLGQVYRRSGLAEKAKLEFEKASALDAAHLSE